MVCFVGAGPGDPELITVKGKKALETARCVIYAGSLVNEALLSYTPAGCAIYNSAGMTLDEVLAVMRDNERAGIDTVRLHTGDMSLFGAVREQYDALERDGIPYCVIPGVSSFLAAAASMKKEYTLPGVSQTVIITRMEGRTPTPESIEELAKNRATMVIFLSVGFIEDLTRRLMKSYPSDTPAAAVYKASWEDERIVRGCLRDIAQRVKEAGINKTALVMVGDFLGDDYELSKLYDRHFTHEYRKGEA